MGLTQEQQMEHFMIGFQDQLEKTAFIPQMTAKILPHLLKWKKLLTTPSKTNIGKFVIGIKNAKGKRLEYLSKMSDPLERAMRNTKGKGFKMPKIDPLQQVGGAGGTLSRGIRTSIGNTALNLQTLSKGLKGQGFVKGTGQFVKNLGTMSKNQIRGSRLKEIDLTNKHLYYDIKSKNTFLRGSGPLGRFKIFDRKVVGTINKGGRNTVIVKKRPLAHAASATLTAPGILATAPLLNLGDKTDKKGKKIPFAKRYLKAVPKALPEVATWGVARPLGYGIEGVRGIKGIHSLLNTT